MRINLLMKLQRKSFQQFQLISYNVESHQILVNKTFDLKTLRLEDLIMVLGPKELLQLVKKIKLVEGLSERELTNPEGAGFDLRLGEVYKISGKAFLGETHRQTPDISSVAKYEEAQEVRHSGKRGTSASRISKKKDPGQARMTASQSIKIKPGDFFLVKTIEKINLPINLSAVILPRTTTFRSGLFLRTGPIQPGYSGELTFGLKNEGPITVEVEMGARFVHVIFHEIKGEGSKYRGQWQGGRVSATKREKQV
jgi:dCTP deaminase